MLDFLRRLFGKRAALKPAVVRPVGDALEVEPGKSGQPLRDAVAAIDRVHQDGVLPVIPVTPVTHSPLIDRHGQFSKIAGQISIEVNPASQSAALTVVHEVGHFLDYSGLGNPGEWASEMPGAMDRWRAAISESRGIQRLRPLLEAGADRTIETLTDGTVVEYRVKQGYLRYMLRPRELWARSYAQFIAVESADLTLLHQLDDLRSRPLNRFYYGEQWGNEDFLPILASIEAIFCDLGWM